MSSIITPIETFKQLRDHIKRLYRSQGYWCVGSGHGFFRVRQFYNTQNSSCVRPSPEMYKFPRRTLCLNGQTIVTVVKITTKKVTVFEERRKNG